MMDFIFTNYKKINNIFFIKCIFGLVATAFPFNFLRIFFLNLIPGFTFKNCYVGYFNFFLVNEFFNSNSKIGNFNFFILNKIDCSNKSIIGSYNKIFSNFQNSNLSMERSQISINNIFYLSKDTRIGKNVVFGGMNSKIFLNRSLEKNTSFGENIFIGSNCIFITGIKLEKDIIIGAGSVVLDSIIDPGLYYSKKLIRNEK